MLKIKHFSIVAMATMWALTANAGNLWIIGDAAPSGWSMDKATALLSDENPSVYTGTIYLLADKEFKFLTEPDWGNPEYGAAPDAVMTDGTIALATGKDDNGYSKLKVSESANYLITVDTDALTAKIVKSEYQATEITLCSIFLVGSATPNSWSVMDGTPLYQSIDKPYEFERSNLHLTTGEFKIATDLVGASHWDPAYWYFRDADDSNKIVLNQDGDLKWDITEDGNYDLAVNLVDNTISISKSSTSGITAIETEEAPAEFYSITGVKVANPAKGIYIRKTADGAKVVNIR